LIFFIENSASVRYANRLAYPLLKESRKTTINTSHSKTVKLFCAKPSTCKIKLLKFNSFHSEIHSTLIDHIKTHLI